MSIQQRVYYKFVAKWQKQNKQKTCTVNVNKK